MFEVHRTNELDISPATTAGSLRKRALLGPKKIERGPIRIFMMSGRLGISLWLLVLCGSSVASQLGFRTGGPIPPNAKVTLSTDKDEYFLGENVLVHFKLENTGGPAFDAEFGGDYRGAPRSLRFIVTATDPNGKLVADPYPNSNCMGGLGGPATVTPDRPFYQSLPIMRYLRFEGPGTYTVFIHHDCGWKESADTKYPEGRIVLCLKRPSKEQARRLVQAWMAEKPYQGSVHGQKSQPYADFGEIRFAEYLEPLAEQALQGKDRALAGIGSIATPEATRVLIDLLRGEDDDFRLKVCRTLNSRLPDPYLQGLLSERNIFVDEMKEPRLWLVERSWRPEFADEVRQQAAHFLEGPKAESVALGAYMMECVGNASDAPLIEHALNREVAKTPTLPLEKGIYPRPRGACEELLRAVQIMLKRGAAAPEKPESHGQAIFFLRALASDPNFRPDGWLQTCDRLLQSDIPYIQEQTLRALPAPMPATLQKWLTPILGSADPDAAIEADRIIERDKLGDPKDMAIRSFRTAKDSWLFRASGNALLSLGCVYERLEILADRMDEPDMLFDCLEGLKTIFSNAGGGGFSSNIGVEVEAKRIKPKWQAFIRKHEQDLKNARRFKLPDPEIPADMFPAQYSITLTEGRAWP